MYRDDKKHKKEQELSENKGNIRNEGEALFSTVFRMSPDILTLTTFPDGNFIDVNDRFLEVTGYRKEELIGKSSVGIGLWNDPAARDRMITMLREQGSCSNLESTFRIKSGEVRTGLLSASLVRVGDKPHLLTISKDMTGIREAELTLDAARERHEEMIRCAPNGIMVLDKSGIITMINPAYTETWGFTEEDVVGKHFSKIEALRKEDLPEITRIFSDLIEEKGPRKLEIECLYKDGRPGFAEVSPALLHRDGKINGILAIINEITERKRSETVRQIMYNISDAVNHTKNLNELFLVIQKELGQVFDTTNFFIAFYDKKEDTLSLPYFVDEKDHFEVFPAKKSLTGYMIRNDRALLMKNKDIEKLVKAGEVDDVGTPSKIWLGVPLKIREEIIGGLVVQHYKDENAYTGRDLEILEFVSTQLGFNIETKKAYDEIRIEKAYFEQLFQFSPETIVVADNEGRVLRVNDEFEKLFGFSSEEIIGKLIDDLVVPDAYEKEARNLTRTLVRGEKIGLETIRKHKDGHLINISLLGTPIQGRNGQEAVYIIYRDITDRKEAEAELESSRRQYRMITELTSDFSYSYLVDRKGGLQLDWVAGALKDLTGFSLDEINGSGGWEDLVHPDDVATGKKQLAILLQNKSSSIEYRMVTKSGQNIWVSDFAKPVWDKDENRVVSFYGAVKDITERRNFEESLKIAKEKAEQSDRLKSAFLANMSHEIRTPMNAILGFSELIRNEDLSREDKEEYIRIIRNKGNELLYIINDIIDISKIEAGDINIVNKDIDLNGFIREVVSQAEEEKSLLDRDEIGIRTSLPELVETSMHTDPVRLGQVMNNLITNALKFTEMGTIEIGYQVLNDTQVQIFVEDTGIGISKDEQEIIFDRFRQVNESTISGVGGTGLGLAISKNLVNLMGGTLKVYSEPGRGSRFFFDLAVKEIRKKPGADANGLKPEARPGSRIMLPDRKILIAEDDASNFLFLETFLKNAGAEVFWAKDGAAALDVLGSEKGIDLVIMDIRMPRMNGIEAILRIRKNDGKLPVIALSAHAFAEDREQAVRAGCNAYLAKPVRLEHLAEVIFGFLS